MTSRRDASIAKRYSSSAIGIRFAIVVLAAAATALIPTPSGLTVAFVLVGTVLAATVPTFAGALLVLIAEVLGWTSAYGSDSFPPIGRTVAFAALLYLVHAATSLAASVPSEATVERAVLVRWAVACVPALICTIAAGVAVALLGRSSGSPALDIVGLSAVAIVLAGLVWIARTKH
jgi:hypothetical protein